MKKVKLFANLGIAAMVAAAIITIGLTKFIIEATSPEMGIYSGAISGFTIFMILVEYRQVRFSKGMCLIAYGVLFQTIFPKIYLSIIDHNNPDFEYLSIQLELYTQGLLLACAGAGGSIIANHADKSSIDREEKPASNSTIDNTKNIDNLIKISNRIEKRINLSLQISLAAVSITLAVAILMVFK